MALHVLLGIAGTVVLLTLVLPTWRRMWIFQITVLKYIGLLLLDIFQLRRIAALASGRSYQKLTRPVLLRRMCEDLGPTFIKFGQIIASSSGMFPERYTQEFQKCLDRVRPFPFAEAKRILASELGREKAGQLEELDPVPLASASIAQVHTASFRDGTKVVVKIQRPGIDSVCEADMRIMRVVARIAEKFVRDAELANPVGIVEDFTETLREELDFRKEAKNLDRFNEIMAELGHKNIRAPVPHWEMTTKRVLVMERFFGLRVDQVDEIAAAGVDAEEALVTGLRAWFQCVIFYGFFHGDVHAGNLMLLDNHDLGFLDFGIVGRFDDGQRAEVTEYVFAFAGGQYRKLAETLVRMGGVDPERLDIDAFAADLEAAYSPIIKMKFSEINYAELLPEIQRVATKHRLTMPKEFVLITKQMLYFDRYAKLLAPNLNIFTDPRLLMTLAADLAQAKKAQAGRAQAESR